MSNYSPFLIPTVDAPVLFGVLRKHAEAFANYTASDGVDVGFLEQLRADLAGSHDDVETTGIVLRCVLASDALIQHNARLAAERIIEQQDGEGANVNLQLLAAGASTVPAKAQQLANGKMKLKYDAGEMVRLCRRLGGEGSGTMRRAISVEAGGDRGRGRRLIVTGDEAESYAELAAGLAGGDAFGDSSRVDALGVAAKVEAPEYARAMGRRAGAIAALTAEEKEVLTPPRVKEASQGLKQFAVMYSKMAEAMPANLSGALGKMLDIGPWSLFETLDKKPNFSFAEYRNLILSSSELVETMCPSGRLPIRYFFLFGGLADMKALLRLSPDAVRMYDVQGRCAVDDAVVTGTTPDMLEILFEAFGQEIIEHKVIGKSLMSLALVNNNHAAVEMLLEWGYDGEGDEEIDQVQIDNFLALANPASDLRLALEGIRKNVQPVNQSREEVRSSMLRAGGMMKNRKGNHGS